MSSSERIRMVLEGKIPDRVPICKISFWPKTIERWKKEGIPEDIDPIEYLREDLIRTYLEGRTKGDFIALTIEEPAWFILERTFGFENGLPLFIEEKDLVVEIMEKVVDFNI
ncbi:MAG: hypothetical protein N2589_04210 [bacterium]|nr:hypothetical protein [bacterium]